MQFRDKEEYLLHQQLLDQRRQANERDLKRRTRQQVLRNVKGNMFSAYVWGPRIAGAVGIYVAHKHGFFDPIVTQPSLLTKANILPVSEIVGTYYASRFVGTWAWGVLTQSRARAGYYDVPAFMPGRVSRLITAAFVAAGIVVGARFVGPYLPFPKNSNFVHGVKRIDGWIDDKMEDVLRWGGAKIEKYWNTDASVRPRLSIVLQHRSMNRG